MIPKLTGGLSILGSAYIIWDVAFRSKSLRKSTQKRILFGMSCCDIIASGFGFFPTSWPIPEIYPIWGASGNQASCNAQGFFITFSTTLSLYNAALTFFYLAKIRYQVSSTAMTQRIEPFLHAIPILGGLALSTSALALDLFNPFDGHSCFIASVPFLCADSWSQSSNSELPPCIRGDNASIYRWILFFGPAWVDLILVSCNMFLVYMAVYSREKKMSRYNFEYQRERDRIQRTSRPNSQATSDHEGEEPRDSDEESSIGSWSSISSHQSVLSNVSSVTRNLNKTAESLITSIQKINVAEGSRRILERATSSRRRAEKKDKYFRHSVRVARQGYWYCGAFLVSWLPSSILMVIVIARPAPYFLHVLTVLTVPAQGFLNFLVYVFPKLKRAVLKHWKEQAEKGPSYCCCRKPGSDGAIVATDGDNRQTRGTVSSLSNDKISTSEAMRTRAEDLSSSGITTTTMDASSARLGRSFTNTNAVPPMLEEDTA